MQAPMYSITFHRPERLVRLTWLSGTTGMTDEDFRHTLEVFAESALQHRAERAIIDVREFDHRPSKEVLAWRDETTVAKYNRAGIVRQAWVWPGDTSSMKPSSAKRSYEEKYFSSENEAIDWVLAETAR
jgi:hypothetical protein